MNPETRKRLERLLVATGAAPEEMIESVKDEPSEALASVLVSEHNCDRTRVLQILSEVYRVPSVDITRETCSVTMLEKVAPEICLKTMSIPVFEDSGHAIVAFADPDNLSHVDEMQAALGKSVQIRVTLGCDIQHFFLETGSLETVDDLVDSIVNGDKGENPPVRVTTQSEARNPVAKELDKILCEAVERKALHLYLMPFDLEVTHVRMALEDKIIQTRKYAARMHEKVVNRLRVLCDLLGKDKRVPQNGSFLKVYGGEKHRFDVMIMPSPTGDAITIFVDQNLSMEPKDAKKTAECKKCGAAIRDDWKFCPECGAKP